MKKIVGILGIVIAVTAMVLMGLQVISPLQFWILIGITFVMAYWLLPKMSK